MELCIFCKKEFSNKYTLHTHQEKSKRCISNRENTISKGFNCNGCKQSFDKKFILERHQNTCKKYNEKVQQQIEEDNKIVKRITDENTYLTLHITTLQKEYDEQIDKLKEETGSLTLKLSIIEKTYSEKQKKLEEENTHLKLNIVTYQTKIEQLEKQNENMNAIIKSTLSESVNKPRPFVKRPYPKTQS